MIDNLAPWGEAHLERQKNWYQHLPASPETWDTKQDYQRLRQEALSNPHVDLFDRWMPTGQPKRDIGAYALSQGISVPLISDMETWQDAMHSGTAMLRSEAPQDYKGLSGLLSSSRIAYIPHKDPYFLKGRWDDSNPEGPHNAHLDIVARYNLRSSFSRSSTIQFDTALRKLLLSGLYEGTVDPAYVMEMSIWQEERNEQYTSNYQGYPLDIPDNVKASRWRYIPGINLKVFRDPVIEGRYFIGSNAAAHHTWEVTEGVDSPPIEAHDKQGWRQGKQGSHEPSFEYELPAGKIVEFYEKVRTLPYFDQRQSPLLELQYDTNGKLHFLQYLKTGHVIADPGKFQLPEGRNVVTSHHVRGATTKTGEKVRIYIDPEKYSPDIRGQAFFAGFDMARGSGNALQTASMLAKVAIVYGLSFKDNHFSDAPLFRPPVVIDMWDSVGEVDERIHSLEAQINPVYADEVVKHLDYVDAIVTSNGRRATIESDWELKKTDLR